MELGESGGGKWSWRSLVGGRVDLGESGGGERSWGKSGGGEWIWGKSLMVQLS